MEHPLEGCRAKIDRARTHLKALYAEVRNFIDSNPCEFPSEFDSEAGKHITRVRLLREPDELAWGILLGDFAHNLRSALDHLVWQLVLFNGRKPTTDNQFPIAVRGTQYWCARKDGRPSMRDTMLNGVAEDARAIIDTVQPYRRRDDPKDTPLAALNWLSNVDKHRVVHATLLALLEPDRDAFTVITPGQEAIADIKYNTGPLKDGAVVSEIGFRDIEPDAEVHVEADVPIGIGFGQGGLRVEGLDPIVVHVETIVSEFDKTLFGKSG